MRLSQDRLDGITPNSQTLFGNEAARVQVLPLLWAAYERDVTVGGTVCSLIPTTLADQIMSAWVGAGGLPDVNPVEKIPLKIQQLGDELMIVPFRHIQPLPPATSVPAPEAGTDAVTVAVAAAAVTGVGTPTTPYYVGGGGGFDSDFMC